MDGRTLATEIKAISTSQSSFFLWCSSFMRAHIQSISIIQCQLCHSGEGCWVNQGFTAVLTSTATILMAVLSSWLQRLYKADENY